MARLRRLLPAWETYSPLMEVPDRLVTGVRPGVGGELGAGVEGPSEGLGEKDCGGRGPWPGHGWWGPGKRGWATRRVLDLRGDVMSLGVQGGQLSGQAAPTPAALVPATTTLWA